MLYTLGYQTDKGVYQLPVCVGVKTNGKMRYIGMKALLSNKDLILELRHNGINIGVKYLDKLGKPVPVSIGGGNQMQSLTKFFELLKKNDFKAYTDEEIKRLFNNTLNEAQFEQVKNLFKYILEFREFQSNPIKFKIEIPNSVAVDAQTIKAIQDLNASQVELEFVKKGLNQNKFMNTPQDEVFLKLLTYSDLMADVIEKPFPLSSAIYNPYRTKDFRMPFYQNKLLPTDDRKLIEGNADNNDLPIQPNEKTFYDAMCELMDYGIKQEYPNVSVEQARKDGISSKVVKDYLIELAVEVCKWNWSHTGFLEFDVDFDDDDDDDTPELEDSTDATLGNSSFLESENNRRGESGSYILRAYLEKASDKNIYAPCEAVVKLLRWGERKPTRLKLEGIDRYLIFKSFTTSALSGSLSNLEIVKEGTKQYRPSRVVMAYGSFQDMKYLKGQGFTDDTLNVPVGLLCIVEYISGQKREVYFSMVDVVNDIEQGRNEIFDLERDENGNIRLNKEFGPDDMISLSDVTVKVNNDVDSTTVYYTDDAIKDLYLKYKCDVSKASYLAVWNIFLSMLNVSGELETSSFVDEQDLRYKMQSMGYSLKSYLEANIAKATLPIVLDVANRCENARNESGEPSISAVINMYNIALLKRDIVDIMNPKEDKGSTNSKLSALESKMSKMSNFESKEKPAEEKIQKEVLVESQAGIKQVEKLDLFEPLLRKPSEKDVFCRVVYEEKEVGAIAVTKVNGKTKYILMTMQECTYPLGSKRLQLIQTLKVLVNDFYFTLLGEPEKCTFRFYSKDTLKFYRDLLKKLV